MLNRRDAQDSETASLFVLTLNSPSDIRVAKLDRNNEQTALVSDRHRKRKQNVRQKTYAKCLAAPPMGMASLALFTLIAGTSLMAQQTGDNNTTTPIKHVDRDHRRKPQLRPRLCHLPTQEAIN